MSNFEPIKTNPVFPLHRTKKLNEKSRNDTHFICPNGSTSTQDNSLTGCVIAGAAVSGNYSVLNYVSGIPDIHSVKCVIGHPGRVNWAKFHTKGVAELPSGEPFLALAFGRV